MSAQPGPAPNPSFSLKKADDPMSFDLRESISGRVRRPSHDEYRAIQSIFPTCTGYKISGPVLVLQCPEPPTFTPVTVAGLPAVFVPDMRDYDDLGGVLGNPTIRLPGSNYKAAPNQYPTFPQMEEVFHELADSYPNVQSVGWRYTHFVTTLTSSHFDPASYPGKIGNSVVVYTWPGRFKPHSQSRLMTPSQTPGGDFTDYRMLGLTPGIKVVGHRMATSSGVLVQNGGQLRLTLADHGFADTDHVYHPDPLPHWQIGTISQRYPLMDIALASAPPNYSNKSYFTANIPRGLVSTDFVASRLGMPTWFEAEGFTTGRIHMAYTGPAVGYPDVPAYIHNSYLMRMYNFEYFGPEVGEAKEGACGAPVVFEATDDEELDGVTIGFVWLLCGRDMIVAAVDELLDDGWQIADV